jgi:hypothetical protein
MYSCPSSRKRTGLSGRLNVLGHRGGNLLGGNDIDRSIMEHVRLPALEQPMMIYGCRDRMLRAALCFPGCGSRPGRPRLTCQQTSKLGLINKSLLIILIHDKTTHCITRAESSVLHCPPLEDRSSIDFCMLILVSAIVARELQRGIGSAPTAIVCAHSPSKMELI